MLLIAKNVKTIKTIVQETTKEVSSDFFDQETIDQKMLELKQLDDDNKYVNEVFSFMIETCTSYSSTVLFNVLETMKKEGYFKVKK